MDCPYCIKGMHVTQANEVRLLACPACKSLWMSSIALALLQRQQSNSPLSLTLLDQSLTESTRAARRCPSCCKVELGMARLGSAVFVEASPKRCGILLDRESLVKLKELIPDRTAVNQWDSFESEYVVEGLF